MRSHDLALTLVLLAALYGSAVLVIIVFYVKLFCLYRNNLGIGKKLSGGKNLGQSLGREVGVDQMQAARALVLVAQTLSFTEAAAIMGTSVAVVSRQIAALERKLGVRLLQRSTRQVTVTAAGLELVPRLQAWLKEADELFAPAQGLQGSLRIAASMPFFDLDIVTLLAQFQHEHPNLTLNFTLTSAPLDLVRDSIDIGFQEGTAVAPGYIARKLGSIASWMVASPQYLASLGTPKCLEDLLAHRLLSIASCHDEWKFVPAAGSGPVRQLKIKPVFVSNYSQAMLTMCRAGVGISFQPIQVSAALVRSGELEVVLPQWRGVPHEVYAAVASRLNLSPTVRELLTFVSAKLPELSSA